MTGYDLTETQARKHICQIGRLMRRYGYIDATAGNISVRLDSERILATPSGLAKGRMRPDQLIVVDMNGRKLGPDTARNRNLHPTSELLMHLECYKQRPDVNAVVHAHPPTAVALTIAGISLETCLVPEVIIVLGLVPTAPYAAPCGEEDRDSIRDLVAKHDAVMLANHGSLTLGADLRTAYNRLEMLEHDANILFKVERLGGAEPLPYTEVEKLLSIRRASGYARPEDTQLFKDFYVHA